MEVTDSVKRGVEVETISFFLGQQNRTSKSSHSPVTCISFAQINLLNLKNGNWHLTHPLFEIPMVHSGFSSGLSSLTLWTRMLSL